MFGFTQSTTFKRICGHPIILFIYLNVLLQAENILGVFLTLHNVYSRGRPESIKNDDQRCQPQHWVDVVSISARMMRGDVFLLPAHACHDELLYFWQFLLTPVWPSHILPFITLFSFMKLTPLIPLLFPNFRGEPHFYKSLVGPSLKFLPDGLRVLLFLP